MKRYLIIVALLVLSSQQCVAQRLFSNWPPNGLFDVRDFGATGDGATDDTVQIQAAINAAAAAQGEIICPPGNYLTGPLVMTSPSVSWHGWGPITYSESAPFVGCVLVARSDIGSNTGVLISNNSPGVITDGTGGAFATTAPTANEVVYFTSTGALPTGLTLGIPYYVVGSSIGVGGACPGATCKYSVSATSGGTAINTSSAGSGTHTRHTDLLYQAAGSQIQVGPAFQNMAFAGNARVGYCAHFNDVMKGHFLHVAFRDCGTGIAWEGKDDFSDWVVDGGSVFRNNVVAIDNMIGADGLATGGQNHIANNIFVVVTLGDIAIRWSTGANGAGGLISGNHITGSTNGITGISTNADGIAIVGNTIEGVAPWITIPMATAGGSNAGRGVTISANLLDEYLNIQQAFTCDTVNTSSVLQNCTPSPVGTLPANTSGVEPFEIKIAAPGTTDIPTYTRDSASGQLDGGTYATSWNTNSITMSNPATAAHTGLTVTLCSPEFAWKHGLAPTGGPPVTWGNTYVSGGGCNGPNTNGL